MIKIRLLFLLLISGFVISAQAATLQEARKLYHAGKLNSALLQTNELLKANAKNIPALFLKAQIESESKDLEDAINTYRAIVLIEPNHLQAYNNLAALYAQQGNLKQAADTLETAIGTDTVFMTIHTNLRAIYMDMSQKHYRQALKLETEKNPTLIASIDIDEANEQILQEEVQVVPDSIQDAINTTVARNPPPKRPSPGKVSSNTKEQPPAAAPEPGKKRSEPAKEKSAAQLPPAEKAAPPAKKIASAKKKPTAAPDQAAEVKKALLAWARSWSARDVNVYTASYVSNYATFGRTHKDWVASRNWNFKNKKFIKVRLSNISIQPDGEQFRVQFVQKYESDSYRDTVNKELIFVPRNGEWKIAKEISN